MSSRTIRSGRGARQPFSPLYLSPFLHLIFSHLSTHLTSPQYCSAFRFFRELSSPPKTPHLTAQHLVIFSDPHNIISQNQRLSSILNPSFIVETSLGLIARGLSIFATQRQPRLALALIFQPPLGGRGREGAVLVFVSHLITSTSTRSSLPGNLQINAYVRVGLVFFTWPARISLQC